MTKTANLPFVSALPNVLFRVDDHKPFTNPGPAQVAGHAIFVRPNQRFHVCRHAPVIAFPDTSYTREVISILRAGKSPGRSPFSKKDFPNLVFHTSCDRYGNFHLYDMQARRYFFAAEVSWIEQAEYQRGTLLTSIELASGSNPLILTNWHPPPRETI